ncbi:MAG: hypothetical protein GKR77_03270, partial [Legionellales bacterium]|nr:hypothetical protein [Legionellales bacterium]
MSIHTETVSREVSRFNLLESEVYDFFHKRIANESLSLNRRLDIASIILSLPDYLIRSNASFEEKISHIERAKRHTLLHYHPDKVANVIKVVELVQKAADLLWSFIFSQLPENAACKSLPQYQYMLVSSSELELQDYISIASQTAVQLRRHWNDFSRSNAATVFRKSENGESSATPNYTEKMVKGDIAFCLLAKAGALPDALNESHLEQLLEQTGDKKPFFCETACLMLMQTRDWFLHGISVVGNNNCEVFQYCYQQSPEIFSPSRLEQILEEGHLSEAEMIAVITQMPGNLRYVSINSFIWLIQRSPSILNEVLRFAVLVGHLRDSYFIQASIFDQILDCYEDSTKRIIKHLLLGNRTILSYIDVKQCSQIISDINAIPEHAVVLSWVLAAVEHQRSVGQRGLETLDRSVRDFFYEEEFSYVASIRGHEDDLIFQYCYQQFPEIIFRNRLDHMLIKERVSEKNIIKTIIRAPDNLRRMPIETFSWLVQKFSPLLNTVLGSAVLMKYLRENSHFIGTLVFDPVLIPYEDSIKRIITQLLVGNRKILSWLHDEKLSYIVSVTENESKYATSLVWLLAAVRQEQQQRRVDQRRLALPSDDGENIQGGDQKNSENFSQLDISRMRYLRGDGPFMRPPASQKVDDFFWQEMMPPARWIFLDEMKIKSEILIGDVKWGLVLSDEILSSLHRTYRIAIAEELLTDGNSLSAEKYLRAFCQEIDIYFDQENIEEVFNDVKQEAAIIEKRKAEYLSEQLDSLESEFERMLMDPEADEVSLKQQLVRMNDFSCEERTYWFIERVRAELTADAEVTACMSNDEKTDDLVKKQKRRVEILSYLPETFLTPFIKKMYVGFKETMKSIRSPDRNDRLDEIRGQVENRVRNFWALPEIFFEIFLRRPLIDYDSIFCKILTGSNLDQATAEKLSVNDQSYEILSALERLFDFYSIDEDASTFYKDIVRCSKSKELKEQINDLNFLNSLPKTFDRELIRQWILDFLKEQLGLYTRAHAYFTCRNVNNDLIPQIMQTYSHLNSQDQETVQGQLEDSYNYWIREWSSSDALLKYCHVRAHVSANERFQSLEYRAVAYQIGMLLQRFFKKYLDPFVFPFFSSIPQRSSEFYDENKEILQHAHFGPIGSQPLGDLIKKVHGLFVFLCQILCESCISAAKLQEIWTRITENYPYPLMDYFPPHFANENHHEQKRYLKAMSNYHQQQISLPADQRQPLLIEADSYPSIVFRQEFERKHPQCVSLIQEDNHLATLCRMLKKLYLGKTDSCTISALSTRVSIFGSHLFDGRVGRRNISEVMAFINEY